jgi:hypothetical protein
LRTNDESADAVTHYDDCGLPKCDAMLFGELLPRVWWQCSSGWWWLLVTIHQTSQRIIAQAAVLTLTALNSNFKKQQGHAAVYVTTGDEIKGYDRGGMW